MAKILIRKSQQSLTPRRPGTEIDPVNRGDMFSQLERLPLADALRLHSMAISSRDYGHGFKHGSFWILPGGHIVGHEHDLDKGSRATHQKQVERWFAKSGMSYGMDHHREEAGIQDLGAVRINTTKDFMGGGIGILAHGQPTKQQMAAIHSFILGAPSERFEYQISDPHYRYSANQNIHKVKQLSGTSLEGFLDDVVKHPVNHRAQAIREAMQAVQKSISGPSDPMSPHRLSGGDPKFFSGLHHFLSGRMKSPMQAPDLVKFAANNGVSKDEIEWSGLHKLEGKVTPQQALDHVKSNAPKLSVSTLGHDPNSVSNTRWTQHPNDEFWGSHMEGIPKGGKWHVLHVDEKPKTFVYERPDADAQYRTAEFFNRDADGRMYKEGYSAHPIDTAKHAEEGRHKKPGPGAIYDSYSMPGGENYREDLLKMDGPEQYSSGHWNGHPNVIAHLRMKDRTDADGKRALNLEEVQSDWHQDGREKGYKSSRIDEFESVLKNRNQALETYERDPSANNFRLYQEEDGLLADFEYRHPDDAPFKDDHWHQLAIRHALHEAAKGGYDRLSINPSNVQNGEWKDEPEEGQQHYYDRKYPGYLDKLAKRFGTTTGKSASVYKDTGRYSGTKRMVPREDMAEVSQRDPNGYGYLPIHSHHIDITPEMREHILAHGVPLWGDWHSNRVRKAIVLIRKARISRRWLQKAVWNNALVHAAEHGRFQGFISPTGKITPHLGNHDDHAKSLGFRGTDDYLQSTGNIRVGISGFHDSPVKLAYATYHADHPPTPEQEIAVATTLGTLRKEGYGTHIERLHPGAQYAYKRGATSTREL